MAHAVTMIVALTVKLVNTERVRNALSETKTTRDAETNAKIVDLLKAGLAETKQQRHAKDNGREERKSETERERQRKRERERER